MRLSSTSLLIAAQHLVRQRLTDPAISSPLGNCFAAAVELCFDLLPCFELLHCRALMAKLVNFGAIIG